VTVEPLTGGQENAVFALTLGNEERIVLRLHPRADGFSGTIHTIHTLRALGLPVPQVIASGQHPAHAWLLLHWTPGRELRWALSSMTQSQQTDVAEQLVRFQRCVNALPRGTGFGYVPHGVPGTHTSWQELIRAGAAPPEIANYLRSVVPTCFLDDITGKNVIIDNGELNGLIDLDHVCYGDPLYWLALTQVGLVCDIGVAGDFYSAELIRLWNPTPLERRVLAYYAIRMADEFIGWYAATESPEWLLRMTAARTNFRSQSDTTTSSLAPTSDNMEP
jgi:aminoglycoside phosphotransferase (APT) family kinase protein